MELREQIARELCEADCGRITENELDRCRELATVVLSIPEIRDALVAAESVKRMNKAMLPGCRHG